MLITVNDIRAYRAIATNIDDARVNTFIAEAEQLDILPAVGAAEYARLAAGQGLSPDETALLNGGYYVNYAGVEEHQNGVKAALSYLAYARFIRCHGVNITPFGVVVKSADDSQPASQQVVSAAAKDAEQIGREYLAQAVRFWRQVGPQSQPVKRKVKRFVDID